MVLKGFFKADQDEYTLGQPIWITLFLTNSSDEDLYIFVPKVRSGGIQIDVEQGRGYSLKDMTGEPEPGLVGERMLKPGGSCSQRYFLTQWLIFNEPGDFIVRISIRIEVYHSSIRERSERSPEHIAVSSDLHLRIKPL